MSSLLTDAQLQSLQPSPPYAGLAAEGATLRLIGSINLPPEIYDKKYPGKFYVSPGLSTDLILGRPWLWDHNVIHEHRGDCIFLGESERQRVYLSPEIKRRTTEYAVP